MWVLHRLQLSSGETEARLGRGGNALAKNMTFTKAVIQRPSGSGFQQGWSPVR